MFNIFNRKSDHEKNLYILENTHDGNDLAPCHLHLVEGSSNHNLSKKGRKALTDLYKSVISGYTKPFYHGVENMTQDLEGYIYWKEIRIEHYSFDEYEEADIAIKKLESECKTIESKGLEVTSLRLSALWSSNRS